VTPILQPKDWFDARAKARRFSKEITPRQEEVVRLLAEGRQVKEIARLLHVSAKTVEFHKREIMLAYSFKNNADLVLFALKRGLITDTQLE
jgi:DNA-binding NarL/FixJ family response regulator